MLPDNVLSVPTMYAGYNFPDGVITSTLLEDYELGGVALQDPTQGLQVRVWRGYWNPEDSTAYLVTWPEGSPIPIFTEPDVFEFTFSFDQNMRWTAACLLRNGLCKFRRYDTVTNTYVTDTFTGFTGLKLALDDKRTNQTLSGRTDVLLTYLKGSTLYYRQQRDRFETERVLQTDLPANLRITNFGMNNRLRMQWRLRYRTYEELLPWLL